MENNVSNLAVETLLDVHFLDFLHDVTEGNFGFGESTTFLLLALNAFGEGLDLLGKFFTSKSQIFSFKFLNVGIGVLFFLNRLRGSSGSGGGSTDGRLDLLVSFFFFVNTLSFRGVLNDVSSELVGVITLSTFTTRVALTTDQTLTDSQDEFRISTLRA